MLHLEKNCLSISEEIYFVVLLKFYILEWASNVGMLYYNNYPT